MQILRRSLGCFSIAIFALIASEAVRAIAEERAAPHPDLSEAIQKKPDCLEFRNACQVCARQADGIFGCSNIGVACTPNGDWYCSQPPKSEEKAK